MNPDFNDEKLIRDYLLGRLEPPQQDEIEDRLMTDHALEKLAGVVEHEIMDEYLDAPQTHPDRHDIETHFLRPPQRRSKLEFERALRQRLQPYPRPNPPPSPPFYHFMSASSGAAWLMLLLMTMGSGLYIAKLRHDLRSEAARKQEVETTLKAQLEQVKAETEGLQKQLALRTPSPVHPGPHDASIATVELTPNDRGEDAENSVTLPPEDQWFEAQVGLDGAQPPNSCSIVVSSANGRKFWFQIDQKPCFRRDSGVLAFHIPARGLSPGKYSAEITLQWDRPGRPRTYYFRVAR